MLNAGVLTFQEYMVREPLPLATIHEAVLDFLRDRDDVAMFGAQAVNAYVHEPRMTQDIDLLSTRAAELTDELRAHLGQLFHMAVRVREIGEGRGFRIYQSHKSGNRHLVDVRPVEQLPPSQRIEGVLVVLPSDLIAYKVISYHQRRGKPKSGTDWRDLAMLLLTFPDLKTDGGEVSARLRVNGANEAIMSIWRDLVAQQITAEDEDAEF